MRKGITPIIAIIVLLLITVALAGTAWTYLSTYMTGLTGQSVEVMDFFCISGDTAVILVRNAGTTDVDVSDITVIDMSDGAVAGGDWTDASGTTITEITTSGTGKWTATGTCATVDDCKFRILGGARAQTARVIC